MRPNVSGRFVAFHFLILSFAERKRNYVFTCTATAGFLRSQVDAIASLPICLMRNEPPPPNFEVTLIAFPCKKKATLSFSMQFAYAIFVQLMFDARKEQADTSKFSSNVLCRPTLTHPRTYSQHKPTARKEPTKKANAIIPLRHIDCTISNKCSDIFR